MKRRYSLLVYALILYLFLYLPIMLVVIFSFNETNSQSSFEGFSFKWYEALFENERVLSAARNSLVVATLSAILATFLGTLLAFGMWRYHFRGKGILEAFLHIPLVLPEVVMGISFLLFFSLLGLRLSLLTVILSHVTFALPYAALVVRSQLEQYDTTLEDAARDLGASPLEVLGKVTLPILMPGIAAAVLLSVILSLDDVVISFFVSGVRGMTLPVKIFSMVRAGVKPDINALSTLMLIGTFLLALGAKKLFEHFESRRTLVK
ncbi:MAG: ABC transporter permease [Leptospiraceae bacterium]|nr:ABC transporter permease [Leptospiraceae bacterium]MDW8306916.1 ABC transporter permease [Leptospiraceae bacterium]